MRLPLILVSFATNVLWISADDVPSGLYAEKDMFYIMRGFKDGCWPYHCHAGEHFHDALYFNRLCLVDTHPECKDNELIVTLTEDHTTLIGAEMSTEHNSSPVLQIITPLLPGGWKFTEGILKYPSDAFVEGSLDHCGLYYQEGDLLREFQYWHSMPSCYFRYDSKNKYHRVICGDPHTFGQTADTFYLAALKKDGKNCFKSIIDLRIKGIPLRMEGTLRFYKDDHPTKIAQIREDHVKYTLTWDVLPGSNHTKLPSYCRTHNILWAQAAECVQNLMRHSNEYFITSIQADVSDSPGNPVEMRSDARNRYVPAMYVDFHRLLFFGDSDLADLNWETSSSGVAFNLHMNGTADLYIEHDFGFPFSHFKPKAKYQLMTSGSYPSLIYDPYLVSPRWERGHDKFVFLDKEVRRDLTFVYDGFFQVSRMQPTTTTTTTTTTTSKPTTHLQSVHELGQLDAKYRISWLSGCGTVSQECHNSLHLTEAQACVDKASYGCSVKISAVIEHPLSLSAVEAHINGEKIFVPAVFYDPKTLFFASIRFIAVELADYTFGDQAEGDLFISEDMGGNPPRGKVKDSIVHLSLNNGQYIYLDKPIKSSDRKFIFTATIAAVGVKAATL